MHDTKDEASAIDTLGYVAHGTGEYVRALDHTHATLGDHQRAGESRRRAPHLYQTQRRLSDAERVLNDLAALNTDHEPQPG